MLIITRIAGIAQEAHDSGTAAAIRALEKQWTVGQARNDSRALDLIFDDALVYVEYGQLVSKGEYLSRIREQAPGTDQITMEAMSVRISGKTAIVVGSYVERQTTRRHSIQRWRFVDTWIYKRNGWVLVAAGAAPVLK
jgi:ketosteroid isomerase-like protein